MMNAYFLLHNHLSKNTDKIVNIEPCTLIGYYLNQFCKLNDLDLINIVSKSDLGDIEVISNVNPQSTRINAENLELESFWSNSLIFFVQFCVGAIQDYFQASFSWFDDSRLN